MTAVNRTTSDLVAELKEAATVPREEALHPDLAAYRHTVAGLGECIRHPLVVSVPHVDARNAEVNRHYLARRAALTLAEGTGDWSRYVWLHERPWRCTALRAIATRITEDASYWRLVGEIWKDSENFWQNRAAWRWLLSSARPGRQAMMDTDEQAVLAGLPALVTVYRGQAAIAGWSWSLDKEIARWFARRVSVLYGQPRLITGVVQRRSILAYLNRRSEYEVIVDPRRVRQRTMHVLSKAECAPLTVHPGWRTPTT